MKVAIAGYGVEGKASYSYWRQLGHEVTVVDERDLSPYDLPYSSATIFGKNAFKQFRDFDLVIRTPSLAPSKIKTDGTVWSATNEFFEKCPAPIIGVTGTKGKGTTASLIASILQAAGETVHLVGNIGVPALTELPNIATGDIVIFELSSFQLWDLKKSPHIAVVLMIEPDHLDVHKDVDEYIEAKANIRKHQEFDDWCFYHPTNEYSHRIASTVDWHGGTADERQVEDWQKQALQYAIEDDGQVYVKENTFFIRNHPICSVDALQVVGAHNIENACAAISAARQYIDDDTAVEQGLRDFKGLPHRLKLVREVDEVLYYDDSIATTSGSAIAAINALDMPKLLILGGKDKGADYTELVKRCKQTDTHVLTIGANGPAIAKLCQKQHVAVTELSGKTMPEIVAEAQRLAGPGSVVILSPAAASFDMFANYADRGDQFIAAVEGLA